MIRAGLYWNVLNVFEYYLPGVALSLTPGYQALAPKGAAQGRFL
jgi:hypothetical protein